MTSTIKAPEPAADPSVSAIVDALAADPTRVCEFFPLISAAPDEILPGEEHPLVFLPRADGWADS